MLAGSSEGLPPAGGRRLPADDPANFTLPDAPARPDDPAPLPGFTQLAPMRFAPLSPMGEWQPRDVAPAIPVPPLPAWPGQMFGEMDAILDRALSLLGAEQLAPRSGDLIVNLVEMMPRSWEEPIQLWLDEVASLDVEVASWVKSPWWYGSLLVSTVAASGTLYWLLQRTRREDEGHRPEQIDWANEPYPWVES